MTPDEFAAKYAHLATNAPASVQKQQSSPFLQAGLGGMPELAGSTISSLLGNPIQGNLGRLSALSTKAGLETLPMGGDAGRYLGGESYGSLAPKSLSEQLLYHGTQAGTTVAQLAPVQGAIMSALPSLAPRTLGNAMKRSAILGGLYGGATGGIDAASQMTQEALQSGGLSLAAPSAMTLPAAASAIKQAIPTAAQFAAFDAGGIFGARLGAKAVPLKIGEGVVKKLGVKNAQLLHEASARVGGATAGALTGFGTALMGGAPQEEQVAQALLGGAFNLATPSGTQRIQKKPPKPRSILDPNVKQPLLLEGPTQEVQDRIIAKAGQLYSSKVEQRIELQSEQFIKLKMRKLGVSDDVVLDTDPVFQVKGLLRLADHATSIGDSTMAEAYVSHANKILDDLVGTNRQLLLSAKNPTPEDLEVKKLAESKDILKFDKLQRLAEWVGSSFKELVPGSKDVYVVDNQNMDPLSADRYLKDAFQKKFAQAIPYEKITPQQRAQETPKYKGKMKEISSKLENLMLDKELYRQAKEQATQEVLLESWKEKINTIELRAIESALNRSQQVTPTLQMQLAANPSLLPRVQALGWEPHFLNSLETKYRGLALPDLLDAAEALQGAGNIPSDSKTTMDLFRVFEHLDGGKLGGFFDRWLLKPMQKAWIESQVEVGNRTQEFSAHLDRLGFKRNKMATSFLGGRAFNKGEAQKFGRFLNGELKDTDLSPKERKRFVELKEVYKKAMDILYDEMKPILKDLGYGELTYRDNYWAWYRDLEEQSSIFNLRIESPEQRSKFAKAQEVPYKHILPKGEDTSNLIDPFTAFELVNRDASRLKAYALLHKKAKFLSEVSNNIGRNDIHNLMTDLANGMVGAREKSAFDAFFSEHGAGRLISLLTDNFVINVLSTLNPVLNNVLGLPAIAAHLDKHPVQVALSFGANASKEFGSLLARKSIDPNSMTSYLKYSDYAKSRELSHHSSLTRAPSIAESAFAGLYKFFDRAVGSTAWQMGYDKAIRELGMSHPDAVRYGDLIAARTQGVFDTLLKPKMLQGPLGRVMAPLSTGTFAAFNTLFPDIVQNKKLTPVQKANRIGHQIGMTMGVQLGLQIFYGGSGDLGKLFEDSLVAQIPVLGSLVRSGIGGPIGSISRFVDSPTPTSFARTAGILSPVKGGYQAIKTFEGVRALMRDGLVLDKNGEVLYQIDPNSISDVLRSLAFSPSRTDAGRKRYAYLNKSMGYNLATGFQDYLDQWGITSGI